MKISLGRKIVLLVIVVAVIMSGTCPYSESAEMNLR